MGLRNKGTWHKNVSSSINQSAKCDGANIRVFFHVAGMLHYGHACIMIHTTGSYVMVIVASAISEPTNNGRVPCSIRHRSFTLLHHCPTCCTTDERCMVFHIVNVSQNDWAQNYASFLMKSWEESMGGIAAVLRHSWALQRLTGTPAASPTIRNEIMATLELWGTCM